MKNNILEFYLKTSMYTNYIPFQEYYLSLPDDIPELACLVQKQTIHRVTLLQDEKTKKEYPWYRNRCDDDMLLTAPAMMSELFRQDERGITEDREIKDKIIVTCRYVSVLMASILKAKGIPTRVRSGFKVINNKRYGMTKALDLWIVQYYSSKESRWINLDVEEVESRNDTYLFDMNEGDFDFIGQVWLDVRSRKIEVEHFVHGSTYMGLPMIARTLFFDFHALMNDEVSYLFLPTYMDNDSEFDSLTEDNLKELDDLATLLLDPDKNFDDLRYLFYNDKKLRAINTPLVGDEDHNE